MAKKNLNPTNVLNIIDSKEQRKYFRTQRSKRTKTCPLCGETKKRSEYWVDNARYDGMKTYCKQCLVAYYG